ANFWRIDPRWSADVDLSLTRARFVDVDAARDRIPGALENVLAVGLSREPVDEGVFGAVRLRRFGAYPLVDDNSIRAEAASLVNLQLGYSLGHLRLGVAVFNLFDEAHSDIQYYYASRLPGEPAGGVDDLHFHPAEPRAFRVRLSWGF
ncbi:MAG: TonB-dependent receptor, partial [Longimicrobiales bacterium]